jgi:hypothetical protein
MKYHIFLLTLAAFLLLFSCSDNSTEPTKEKNYLPFDIGNYWIYEVKELDGGSNPINNLGMDSMVVVGAITMNDRSGVELHVFRDGVRFDTLYLSVEGESLYQHRDESTDNIPNFDKWLEVINQSGDTWFMHRFTSDNYEYLFGDTTLKVDAEFVYNGYYHGPKKVFIPSTIIEYETLHFSNKLDTKIEFEYILDSVKTDYNIIHTLNMDFYLSDGIGIVNQTYRPSIMYINNQPTYYNGWQRQMIRYNVEETP